MGTSSRWTADGWICNHTCTEIIWSVDGVSWNCQRNIANAARDFSTRKWSYPARFSEATVKHDYMQSCACRRAWFITHSECEACWTCKLSPLHIASPANHNIEIRFGRRHGDSSCVIGGMKRQICNFDVISMWKAISVRIVLRVSIILISVNISRDIIICLCMCKGRTHHVNVVESKSGCKTGNRFDLCSPITVAWEGKGDISDEIY